MNRFLAAGGKLLSRIIQREVRQLPPYRGIDPDRLARIMRPGDVLLVDGNQKVSVAIKYLTQSTWSHAAMFVGTSSLIEDEQGRREALIEVDLEAGCRILPLSAYANFNVRICRPHGLSPDDCARIVQYMHDRLGIKYDLKNVFDLARYLIPTPPVPIRWRRRMIALGSGDPTKAICSSLIAQAFQSVKYPILPSVIKGEAPPGGSSGYTADEIYQIRHHSLFAPRDFDLSPYFSIVKPTIASGFNYKDLAWSSQEANSAQPPDARAAMHFRKS
jgi:hypothetical protein